MKVGSGLAARGTGVKAKCPHLKGRSTRGKKPDQLYNQRLHFLGSKGWKKDLLVEDPSRKPEARGGGSPQLKVIKKKILLEVMG